ncbi:MAG: hypothetical protein KHZ50_09115 [Bacteroides ovatus]|uniref:hypothetical protein n=1 Tax=Butyricimonas sp. TaxID=1969738 RepID=UPI0025BE2B3B|nr:hypothetical protein [Butyricimonas sp.]MBS5203918.1 hypothetical protein [Bacteroides ovatus]
MRRIENHQGFRLRFGEFPDLLFIATDTRTYFDMTHFLQSMKLDPEEKIAEFTAGFALWIDHLGKMYGIPPDERFAVDAATGHSLAEESFALPFLCYADPVFGVYLLDSMSQMLLTGIACSDSYILMQAQQRFTHEELLSTSNTDEL